MVLISCGSSLEPSKNYTDFKIIIGKPIKIKNLEVAQNDFSQYMTWNEAKKECEKLGSGWRLPTKDELNILYQNKDKIVGFANLYYWSSTEVDLTSAWGQNFTNGDETNASKTYLFHVRAIRAF